MNNDKGEYPEYFDSLVEGVVLSTLAEVINYSNLLTKNIEIDANNSMKRERLISPPAELIARHDALLGFAHSLTKLDKSFVSKAQATLRRSWEA